MGPGVGSLKGAEELAGEVGAEEFDVGGNNNEGGATRPAVVGRETGPKGCAGVPNIPTLDILEAADPILPKPLPVPGV